MVNPLCLQFYVYGLGVGFLTIGIITCCFWKHYYKLQLISELALSNDSNSQTTGLWLSNNVPRYFKVYMFNWTNSEKSLTDEEVPQFEECGPYTFKNEVFKNKVIWNDNDTVSYLQQRKWIFIPELSNGSLSDEIVTINVVAIALTYQLKYVSRVLLQFLNKLIKTKLIKIPLVIRETVSNQLFNGYDDGILLFLKYFRDHLNSFSVYETLLLKLENVFLNNKNSTEENGSSVSFLMDRLQNIDNIKNKFAWWYQQNMTEVHHYNIHTGRDDINKLGDIHSWDYKLFCPGNKKIGGSLGDLWPMNTPNKTKAPVFIPEMCSFIDLLNVGSKKVYEINGIEFIGNRKTFGLSRNSSEFRGVQNITDMVKAPIFISFPHFYEANETFRKDIKGMQPNREKHEFYMVLQENSGVVLSGKGRIQLNIMLEPVNEIELVSKLPRLLFPTIWFEFTAVIPTHLMDKMKIGFVVIPFVLANFGIIAIIVGILFLVSGSVLNRIKRL